MPLFIPQYVRFICLNAVNTAHMVVWEQNEWGKPKCIKTCGGSRTPAMHEWYTAYKAKACVHIFMGAFQNGRGLLVLVGKAMKYLQSKTKHFLFKAQQLAQAASWLSDQLARLNLTPTEDGVLCHPSLSPQSVPKQKGKFPPQQKWAMWLASHPVHPGLVVEQCTFMIRQEPLQLFQNITLPFRVTITTSK